MRDFICPQCGQHLAFENSVRCWCSPRTRRPASSMPTIISCVRICM
ncbi:Uncharacterised protein [Mycobacteroides abscessus subsp. abscessus]|nr:Uncharacterised protein [Mycobacteroides abscessus subsp. abscessus]